MTSKARGMRVRGKGGVDRWAYRFKVRGQTYAKTTDLKATVSNQAAAIALMEAHRKQVVEGTARRVISFNEAVEMFMRWSAMEHRDHPNTARRQQVSLNVIKAVFGDRSLDSITAGDLEELKSWRRENLIREVTIRHDIHALSQLMQYGQRKGWVEKNVVREIKIPSDNESRNDRVLIRSEEVAYFKTATPGAPVHDVTKLMRLQGLRPAEALALAKQDLNLEARTLSVHRSLDSSGRVTLVKSKASRRTLDLADESVAILGRRMAGSGPWIFPGKKPGRPYTYSGLVGAHDRVLERVGFAVDIYSFRHTFATDLYRHTKDMALVAKVLGHANMRTVQRYVHLSQEEVSEGVKQFHQALLRRETLDSEEVQ